MQLVKLLLYVLFWSPFTSTCAGPSASPIAMAQTLIPDKSGFLVATLFSGLSVSRTLTLQVITLLNLPLKLGRKEQETPRESKHILLSPFFVKQHLYFLLTINIP